MCSYCGCRANTVIARYSAEHDEIINAMGVLRRAASAGDRDGAGAAASHLAGLLDPHTASEERSLFAELRQDAEFTEHVDGLVLVMGLAAGALGSMFGLQQLEPLAGLAGLFAIGIALAQAPDQLPHLLLTFLD